MRVTVLVLSIAHSLAHVQDSTSLNEWLLLSVGSRDKKSSFYFLVRSCCCRCSRWLLLARSMFGEADLNISSRSDTRARLDGNMMQNTMCR